MLKNLEKKLYDVPVNIYKTVKGAFKKENLDIGVIGGSLVAYYVSAEFFGFLSGVPYKDKIAHAVYGWFLPRAGNYIYANFSGKYETIKGILSGVGLWLAGTFGKEIYDSLIGKGINPYDILATTPLLIPALAAIWRKSKNKKQ